MTNPQLIPQFVVSQQSAMPLVRNPQLPNTNRTVKPVRVSNHTATMVATENGGNKFTA